MEFNYRITKDVDDKLKKVMKSKGIVVKTKCLDYIIQEFAFLEKDNQDLNKKNEKLFNLYCDLKAGIKKKAEADNEYKDFLEKVLSI